MTQETVTQRTACPADAPTALQAGGDELTDAELDHVAGAGGDDLPTEALSLN